MLVILLQHEPVCPLMCHSLQNHLGSPLVSPSPLGNWNWFYYIFNQIHQGMGQYCFCFWTRNCLILKVLVRKRVNHDSRERGRVLNLLSWTFRGSMILKSEISNTFTMKNYQLSLISSTLGYVKSLKKVTCASREMAGKMNWSVSIPFCS